VDAVLGTGLSEVVRGLPARAIAWMNGGAAPVVSVDLPSGVSSDTGRICGAAVEAELTVTFGYPKRGHYLFPGAALAGGLEGVDIGIPPTLAAALAPGLCLVERADCSGLLTRPLDSHKGTFGHVLVLGGSTGKEGAAGLAATAALRAGAGLVTLASPAGLRPSLAARLPLELMTVALTAGEGDELSWGEELWPAAAEAAGRSQALVVGPGMGADEGTLGFLRRLLASETVPLVLDADALNALAARPELWPAGRGEAVLTPHPGEAARMLGVGTRWVQEDRVGAATSLAERFGCAVVLKGAHTLVAAPGTPAYLIPAGNPGMATAGSGDVLSGVVGALLARGLAALEAARLGSYVHALAGDLAGTELGWEGMVAGDLLLRLAPALRLLGGGPAGL
ncbi:MAG: NAD(P)H-hydrate dehydratase, partial [Deltaproteobacteria bacterium]|nr:NAD(P)H-hydrate dehydratase [Deltaproteobacteria bacterium]